MKNIVKKILIIMLIISLLYANGAITINAIANGFISYAIGNIENGINQSKSISSQEETEKETTVELERNEICKTDMEEKIYPFEEKIKVNLINVESKIINISDISNTFYKQENAVEEEIALIYKTTKLNKEELLKVLGKSGTIQIKDKDNDIVILNIGKTELTAMETEEEGKIISTVKDKEEQNIVANIKTYKNEIEIEYVQPVKNIETSITYKTAVLADKEETLNITNTKEIGIIENSTLEEITKLNTKMLYEEKETTEDEKAKKQINIDQDTNVKERATKAEIGINKPELSTTIENDVQFTITLSTENKMNDLFKNPTFKIELPECVEAINTIKKEDIQLLNNKRMVEIREGQQQEEDIFTNLTLNQKNENGKNYIEISMQGEQTQYTESSINNVQIVIPAKIKTSNLLPTTETTLNLYYTNENKTTYPIDSTAFEGSGENNKAIKFVSATGIITKTTVQVLEEKVENYKGETKSLVLPSREGNSGTVQIIAINNEGKDINNAKILGHSQISGAITLENASIKYSTEENATVASSSWSETYQEGAKSYLIQIDNLKQGEKVEYAYNITMPKVEENTTYEQTYTVLDGENQELTKQTTPIDLKTVKLNVDVQSSVGEKPAYIGQELTYTITITNEGETTAEEIAITDTLPQNVSLVNEEDKIAWTNITLQPEESIVKRIKVKVNENEALTPLQNRVEVSAKYLEENIVKTIENTVKQSDIETELITFIDKNSETTEKIEIGATLQYGIDLVNKSGKQQNLTIVATLPENIDKESITAEVLVEEVGEEEEGTGYWYPEEADININGNKITISVELPAKGKKYVSISSIVDKYLGREVKATFNIKYGEEEIILEDMQTQKTPSEITIETATYKGDTKVETEKIYLTPEEELVYEFKLKNSGETAEKLELSGNISKELEVKLVQYIPQEGENTELDDVANIFGVGDIIILEENETGTIRIVVGLKEEITKTTELISKFEISGYYIETKEITMKNTIEIEEDNPDPKVPPEIAIETATYKGETKVETENINLTPEEELVYEFKLTNLGETAETLKFLGKIPKELKVKLVQYIPQEGENTESKDEENTFWINNIELKENEACTIRIVLGLKEELTKTTELKSVFEISGNYMEETKTITMKNILQIEEDNPDPDNPDPDNPDPDNPDLEKYYSISGLAWLDENQNGARDESEDLLKDITVQLLNNSNQIIEETKTNKKGEYSFTELTKGEYIIIFDYNKKLYKITTPKQTGITESINSDAIESTTEGTNITRTDTLLLTKNLTNIDIGLVERGTFDLKIQKQINKITIKNNEGTKVVEYNKASIAKIEIPAKSYLGTTLIIEYEIAIKNEGTVPGYVYSVKDIMPEGTEFLAELNTDWYEQNGSLYSISLTQEEIQPKEIKTLKLVLTKQIETDKAETVVNNAEISETFNEELLEEKSTTNNTSKAETVITIKTGQAKTYVIIAIVVLTIITTGVYIIKKKVLM